MCGMLAICNIQLVGGSIKQKVIDTQCHFCKFDIRPQSALNA